jgi:hypothetical protein
MITPAATTRRSGGNARNRPSDLITMPIVIFISKQLESVYKNLLIQ